MYAAGGYHRQAVSGVQGGYETDEKENSGSRIGGDACSGIVDRLYFF